MHRQLQAMLTTQFKAVRCPIRIDQKRLLSARVEDDDKYVVVQPEAEVKGTTGALKYPSVWLRDNCRCADCFHSSSQSRCINWDRFETRVKIKEISTDSTLKQLRIVWSDRHTSLYDLQWLKDRAFSAKAHENYLTQFYRPKAQHWCGADFRKIVESFTYNDIMHNEEALQSWLEALAVRGVALKSGAPLERSVVRRLADRVGFKRRTTYGEEFIVQSKPNANNYAYLSAPLPAHIDMPYYEYTPGVNLLHCLVQTESEGGVNLLVDGFHVADRLRAEHPPDYHILTQTLVNWSDISTEDGKSFHNIWRAPVICLERDGKYARINHSIPQRDSYFCVPLEAVQPWYDAYAQFVRLAAEESYAFKTTPGDVLTFNNIRLLHGRTGYDDTEHNVRYIVGAYLDWDIIYSKLRVLKTKVSASRRKC